MLRHTLSIKSATVTASSPLSLAMVEKPSSDISNVSRVSILMFFHLDGVASMTLDGFEAG
jgi:hypothetical protein